MRLRAMRGLEQTPELADEYRRWTVSRDRFLHELQQPDSDAQEEGWQRQYMRGVREDGTRAPCHQTKLQLRSFATTDESTASC